MSRFRNEKFTNVVRVCRVRELAMKKAKLVKTPSLIEDRCILSRVASDRQIREARLDMRAWWMLSFIDGKSQLRDVLERAGLPLSEAREAVHELMQQGIVAMRALGREDAWSLRTT
jgi:aminopeptidase-like protein